MKKFCLSLVAIFLFCGVGEAITADEFMKLCSVGTPQQVRAAINAGANVNSGSKEKNKEGWTPLHWAANKNPNPDVIDVLIENGADVNARNKNHGTPLMWAASGNANPKVLETLITWGADVNAKSIIGLTALMLAAQNNPNPQIIETLIDFKADVDAKDKDGNRAFEHAKRNNNIKNSAVYQRLKSRDSGYKRRYMICTENAIVRESPNASSKMNMDIEKGGYALAAAERKNPGEKYPWYKIINVHFMKEEVVGWIYGQSLRNPVVKKNVDMGLKTMNGIAWGTPSSQVKAETEGNYREDGIYLPEASITYLFDAKKRLAGVEVLVFDVEDDENVNNAYSYLSEKFGETENIDETPDGQILKYEFEDFKVSFGYEANSFYYSVRKK